ncbi:hypothetical protein H7698_02555 [Pseudomonas sp. p50]|uniref:hypothetical protein n=1 Tax=Pseudomonas sp. p50(2008) TaxID=2816832 RepID=UPI00188C729C|nr:hypothetical protein [Pseudomonas sp. p50(2008)]MBF4554936.1 hypothetical protein [Pseudomonas sp. p50(2008)]
MIFALENQDQKIAAFGSSYGGSVSFGRIWLAVRPSLRAMGNKKIQQIAGAAETL